MTATSLDWLMTERRSTAPHWPRQASRPGIKTMKIIKVRLALHSVTAFTQVDLASLAKISPVSRIVPFSNGLAKPVYDIKQFVWLACCE